ncbi:peptidoglycan DD-metalloendopeptidase family protein [Streptomyces sp. NPDC020817]|uniref:peptidoglycan DD-metalloendopeptidase family protein n=1 Tax=Streptomyces sp. NPDC020817 TaxID=3365095 RepID=UPI0037B2B5A0
MSLALASPLAHAASTDTWDKVAECESSGNWSTNSGNGFYGGLQFTAATWAAFGGHDHAPQAHQASKEAQIAVAEKVLAKQGPQAWPVCSVTAGLTRKSETPAPATTPIPTPDTTAPSEPSTTPTDSQACEANGAFTVKHGDTLNNLASRLCVGWEDLRDENAIPDYTDPDENLRPGMIIKHRHGHHAHHGHKPHGRHAHGQHPIQQDADPTAQPEQNPTEPHPIAPETGQNPKPAPTQDPMLPPEREAEPDTTAPEPQTEQKTTAPKPEAEQNTIPKPEQNTPTSEPKQASGPVQPANAELNTTAMGTMPVMGGVVTTPYKQPGPWAAGFHTGIDFPVRTGTSVVAAADGTVVTAGWQGSYGNAVIIKHPSGMYTLYAHLKSASVRQGDSVDKAQEIGLSGSTGNSTGPHLHFEARTSNNYSGHTDPVAFLRSLGVKI